jgi:hypothetical protein
MFLNETMRFYSLLDSLARLYVCLYMCVWVFVVVFGFRTAQLDVSIWIILEAINICCTIC